MAIPTDELTRLSTGAPTGYNNDPFNASTNPYGFDDGGYITNFFAALTDLVTVATWVVDEIGPILDITEEIEALGAIVAELQTLAGIAPDVQTLAALDTEVAALAAIAADITTVATNVAAVTAVATDIAKVAAVEAALTDIEAVADALGNISTIIGMAADIATVAARATDIALLADIEDGTTATGAIQTVAGIASAVSNVSSNSADVVAVAGALSDVNTVAGISSDVTALGPIAADIEAVADISADVETAAANISAIVAAPAAAEAARKSVRHTLMDLSSTADSHPGAGHIRLSIDINAASPGATGTLYHDIADADGGDITGWVESWDDVINATGRGINTLVSESDPSISLTLRITGSVSSGTGYRKAPFTLLQKSGTIVDEMEFTESFAPSGNDGDAIGGGATIIGAVTAGELLQAADDSGDNIEGSGKTAANLFDKSADTVDDLTDGSTYVKYAATEQTKLAAIEASADVTDAGNVGAAINGSTAKTTPVNADRFAFWDAAASVLKYVTWQNLLATAKTYFDTLYSAISHTHAFSALTGKPTTLSGYGITDAMPLSGGTFTGAVTLNADPASSLQPATKQYVDGLLANMGKRARVRAATTGNITISTALNNGDSLDGVTLATGDLVLVKDQSTASQNGIYVVGVSPARSPEFDTWAEHPGSLIAVADGTANADTLWLCVSNDGGTLGSTSIAFTKMVIAGELLAGNNLSDLSSVATALSNLGFSSFVAGLVDNANSGDFLSDLGIPFTVGAWTPTATAVTNASAAGATGNARYLRIGNIVICGGRASVDPVTLGVSTVFELSLPVASDLTAFTMAWGVGASDVQTETWGIWGNVTNDTLQFTGIAATTGNHQLHFMAIYILN